MSVTKQEWPVPESVAPYFNAEDKGKEWHLRCKVCDKSWALKKGPTHPGNVLYLLNHAYSHKAA